MSLEWLNDLYGRIMKIVIMYMYSGEGNNKGNLNDSRGK